MIFCRLVVSALMIIGCASCALADNAPSAADIEFFEAKIRPVLVEHCYGCHSGAAKTPKGGLRLDTLEHLRAGGDSGPAIEPGDADNSLLISSLKYEAYEMPPSGKLDDDIIADFVRWIERGAVDPRGKQLSGASGPSDSASHWSFQPIERRAAPAVEHAAWPRGDVDRFVLARQEAIGAHPVSDSDRHSLIRRVTIDLIGLPPTPEEVADFVNDRSADAFARVVDRLLDSPHFGQRWGRHWLDVVRFGESTGHERNFTYPHAWRFRDYVIDSFNRDKPYDQFIREQVAGDLLPYANWRERDEQRIATGMLAIGPKDLLQNPDEQFRADVVDDQIDVVSRAILGLTVSCARCHDHKFDPIPTADYYSLAAIFHSAETLHGTKPGNGAGSNRYPSDLYPLGPNADKLERVYNAHREKVEALGKPLAQAAGAYKRARSAKEQDADEIAKTKRRMEEIEAEVRALEAAAPPAPDYAMGVRTLAKPVETFVLVSGDIRNRGARVEPRMLSALDVAPVRAADGDATGRLRLADWLVDRRNPLTARVMVNRVWRHLFGEGLVETADNFGATGSRPTNPELLDYLAQSFMDEGWSVKRMIRTLVLSRTYGQSSLHENVNHAVDPDNLTLWRMNSRRLEAEVLRDAILSVSGELDRARPSEGSIVAAMGDGCLVRQVKTDKLSLPNRHRSVYLPSCRYFTDEVLDLFDGASPSLVVGDREETNVPSQALYLLNDDFVVHNARCFADRLISETDDDTERIERAYRLALARSPSDYERTHALDYLNDTAHLIARQPDDPLAGRKDAWSAFCQALFMCAEFRYVY